MWGPRTTSGVSYGDQSSDPQDESPGDAKSRPKGEEPEATQARRALLGQAAGGGSDKGSLRGLTLRSGQQLAAFVPLGIAKVRGEHVARRSACAERAQFTVSKP